MAVYKRFNRRKLTSRDPDWSRGTWYIRRKINGRLIHQSVPEAVTKEDAETAERQLVGRKFNARYGVADTSTTFKSMAEGAYTRYVEQHNVNRPAKDLYIRLLVKRFGSVPLSEITPQDCRDAQHYFKITEGTRGKRSPSSVNRIMSTLSRLFSLACEEGILDRNPMQYVKMLKEPPPRARLLTEKEKEGLWEELEKDELLLRFVTLAVNLPLRRGQLLAISPDAIDLQHGLLSAQASKGRERRVIPLNNIALTTLRLMLNERQIPFPLKDIRKRWKRITIAAGINKKDGKRGDNFTFHDLRHELASELLRRNVNPSHIQRLFGHSSLSITDIYMNAGIDDLKAAVNVLDDKIQDSEVIQ